jgi:hypothetical protein
LARNVPILAVTSLRASSQLCWDLCPVAEVLALIFARSVVYTAHLRQKWRAFEGEIAMSQPDPHPAGLAEFIIPKLIVNDRK